MKKNQKNHKSKERTDKEFEDEIKEAIQSESRINRIPKTNYCGLLGTKEGFNILKKMSWVDIEELTDYEFFGE
jgi:hypothetical protein